MKKVSAFDFDGTLTLQETFFPFLFFCKGVWKTSWYLVTLLPALVIYVFCGQNRQKLKESFLQRFFQGESLVDLKTKGTLFFERKVRLNAQVVQKLQTAKKEGHLVVIVSANIAPIVAPCAEHLPVDAVISSELEVDANGLITGKLVGVNCRKTEKVKRLEHLLGERTAYTLFAYGNSDGDAELLAYADFPFWV